jgi:pilus assembly protein Flp/PilA
MKIFTRLLKNQNGATAIEYGLIVALISIAAVIASGMAGNGIVGSFNKVSSTLTSSTNN